MSPVRKRNIVLGLASGVLVLACGSGGGTIVPGDETQPEEDAGVDVTVPDSGNKIDSGNPQDATLPPVLDATLDINLPDGLFWTADGNGVQDTGATDTGSGCSPDEILCNGSTAEICQNGQLSTQVCNGGKVCADGFGCVTCIPGSGTCNGANASLCKSDGSGYVTSTCDGQLGLTCQGGLCTGDCANIGQSYIGCEYYAVTMANPLLNQSTFSFAIAVANTTSNSATVNITGPHAVVGNPFTVAANTIQSIVLPWESSLSCGTGTCSAAPVPPTTLLQTTGAYHVKSTEPVTVYQFNARDYQVAGPTFSFTNDASLLLPVNAMTGKYYVAAYPAFSNEPGLLTIVGTQAGTKVTLSPSTNIVAGGGFAANGGTVTIGAGDVLEVTAPTPGTLTYGSDLSGSFVSAVDANNVEAPVEVFGGHGCVYIPASQLACDHLEEVMFPLETLKTDYVVVPPNMTGIVANQRLSAPAHVVRIIGTAANTTLTYNPAPTVISGTASATVGAGGVVVFETGTPFEVKGSSPILVATYMEGANNYGGGTLNGDPAMSLAVTTGQYRSSYAFTAPNNYQVNWATLIAPTGSSVTIDSTTVAAASFTAIGATGFGYYHYQLCNGNCGSSSSSHNASSANAFGIQVYGYGSYTSYWYPGGLNLSR